MAETLDDAMSRVRKLLRLAGNNSNAHEAALAAAKAQEIMLRWKLDAVDVTLDSDAPKAVDPVRNYYQNDPIDSGKHLAGWKAFLIGAIARANCCKPVHCNDGRRGTTVRVIGTQANAQTVAYLYTYISREIERLCKAEMRENAEAGFGEANGKAWANSYKRGAVEGVRKVLADLKTRIKTEYASNSTALMILSREETALEQFYAQQHFGKARASYSGARDSGAYAQGVAAGRTISVNRGIGDGGRSEPKRMN